MNEYLVCDACGIGNNKKEIRPYHGMMLCPKHRMQIYRYKLGGDVQPHLVVLLVVLHKQRPRRHVEEVLIC